MLPRRLLLLLPLLAPISAQAQNAPLGPEWLKPLTWRCIGPANMGGRITALAVCEDDPTTYYVATASGGLLKTVNNGITFEHQFDRQKVVSIGDVCVAPSNRNIVWIGTGESNPRNSASYGDGVYKSADGGKSWQHVGLKESFQIGKILIHPTNPDVVYVGALGRLWGANEQRGLFKTSDGGKTWDKILYIDDNTGVIDMRMDPSDPDTLLVAMYERRRDGYDENDPAVKWGKGSGLHKTVDGGKTFRRITAGLPTCKLGRIGLDYYRKEPNIVFMILESEDIGKGAAGVKVSDAYMGITGEDAPKGAKLDTIAANGPAAKAGLMAGDIISAFGEQAIASYKDLTKALENASGGDKVKLKVRRDDQLRDVDIVLGKRPGALPDRPYMAYLGGQKENLQTKQGKNGEQYGGVYRSEDGGESWTRINSLNPRPMYFSQIRVDPGDERNLYVLGIELHISRDGGKSFKGGGDAVHADQHALWINPKDGRHMVLGTDGGFYVSYDRMANWDHLNHQAIGQFYHVAVDPRPNYKVYGGLQDNSTWGGPTFTSSLRGPVNTDWFFVGGGDGFRCSVDPHDPDVVYFASQYGKLGRRNFRTGEIASIVPKGKYRFNWNTPHAISHHNSRIYYCAGNFVFRSLDRGNDLRIISPELTTTKRGSATAFSESPRNAEVLYVGTDDGDLWVTQDGGKSWSNITKNVPLTPAPLPQGERGRGEGLPGQRWVASLEASRFADGRVYAVFDGHRSDDEKPYVFVSEDYGKTWTALHEGLPSAPTRVLREDVHNANLLYLGTEFGAWFSLDRGKTWNSLNTNLPTVAVHEIAVHPTQGEIVAATHGRSLWILNVSALQQMQVKDLFTPQLFRPADVVRWVPQPTRGRTLRSFTGENPSPGAHIWYALPEKADKVALKIFDVEGNELRELKAETGPGLHKATWNLTRTAPSKDKDKKLDPSKAPTVPVTANTYRIVLNVDGRAQTQAVRILADPALPVGTLTEELLEEWEAAEEEHEEEEMEFD